ncbi:uncharacterized protein LOC106139472 isoform X2 [Amyelois transitella]|uniref:uncharacterized protein LOC106139472 isoform X2 n=1 Tax=Amyelois transitella TaxID=680683 RepID=UPI00067E1BFB|nr:uncharacterized protein LOC106139472 isoform X2 [Amyelois transitella]
MPMTAAEKQKKYRERLKNQNPEKLEEIKKKAKERSAQYYEKKKSTYTEEDKEKLRQKWKEDRKRAKDAARNDPSTSQASIKLQENNSIHHSEGNASDHSRESSPVPNQRVTNIKRPRLEMTEMEPSSVSIKRKSLKYEETVAPKLSLDHSKISSKYDDEDEFDVFGRNVALQLKKLPLIYALESQELIQRVLKEQRIKAIKKKSSKSQYKTYTVVEPSSSDDRDDPLVMKTEYFDESKKNSLRHHCVS